VIEAVAHRILVVEDDPATAQLLRQVLIAEGHQITTAGDGAEALGLLAEQPPDLLLLDLDLPVLNGYEVCRQIKDNPVTRLIPIIIITGRPASEAKVRSWELGADDFLTKPFRCFEVAARCRSLLRVKRLIDELDSAEAVVFAFARAVEAKSPYTHGHAERVREYALLLAAHVGLPSEEWELLAKGALLHDIGKISVPDAILDKQGPLTPAEFDKVKQHTVQGAHIVEPLRSIRGVTPLIRWHHERCDGRGYPDGLNADKIPLAVRILSVADVYDSLSSRRPYRPAIPNDRCLEILGNDARSGGLDPELVRSFCQIMVAGSPAALESFSQRLRSSSSLPRAEELVLATNPIAPLASASHHGIER
jgi:putative two-component system response regulator